MPFNLKQIYHALEDLDSIEEIVKITEETSLLEMIPYIEKEVRKSKEYITWVMWLRKHHSLNTCDYFEDINALEAGISLEMHHVPTLFDVCYIIGMKMIDELPDGNYLTTFQIADQVIREHIDDNIGVIPLTTTVHEMHHAGLHKITPDKIHGNYKAFFTKYYKYIPEDVKMRIEANYGKTIEDIINLNL
jgi:hypothetical protein